MSDDPRTPEAPLPDDTGRDPVIASALAVPALDDTTRRRLVRTAVQAVSEAPRGFGRMGPALAVAASLLVGAVVGAVVVTRPDDPEPTTAASAPTSLAEAGAEAAPEPRSAADQESPAAVSSAPPVELGDLGPIVGDAGLRRAINTRLRAGAPAAGRATPMPCAQGDPASVGLVVTSAEGTAELDGRTVAVLVGTTPAGDEVAVVLDSAGGCEFIRTVEL